MKLSLYIKHFVSLLLIWTNISVSQTDKSWGPLRIYGVTVDAVDNINATADALQRHCMRPTTRIVFDEWIPATDYVTPVNRIYEVSYIMGEILDSYYFSQYSVQQYVNRTNEYLNVLGGKVYIWEIGNEINGEWLGNKDSVVFKMTQAYNIVKSRNKIAALTLYYNYNCWENPQNEMFRWVLTNVPASMKQGLDYVLVSYYEDDCNNYQPNWQRVFDSLHVIFPNSKLGIGECGTAYADRKETYINRYYRMNITTPNYIGGYFWWYYKQDCVPYTKYLWGVINRAMCLLPAVATDNTNGFGLQNYPNPFNPVTIINYELSRGIGTGEVTSYVELVVYDVLGREITTLLKENQEPGSYEVEFDGSNLSSGIYYYMIDVNGIREIKKMVLIK